MVATQTPNRLLSGPLGDPLLEEFSLSADADGQSDAGEVFGLGPEPGGGGGVAQVSLNELSRRVGLARSNVLRYFESPRGRAPRAARLGLAGVAGRARPGPGRRRPQRAAPRAWRSAGRRTRKFPQRRRSYRSKSSALASKPITCDAVLPAKISIFNCRWPVNCIRTVPTVGPALVVTCGRYCWASQGLPVPAA